MMAVSLRIVSLLALAGPLTATMVPRMSLEEITERSERIVHGRCLRTWSAWDAERQFIWTHAEIQVADTLKGSRSATVVVSEIGGIVGDVGLMVDGMPRYQPGEEVVVFLFRVPNGLWRSRGVGQGKYEIRGGRVRADLSGIALVEPAGVTITAVPSLDGATIAEFKSRIRGLLATRPAGGQR